MKPRTKTLIIVLCRAFIALCLAFIALSAIVVWLDFGPGSLISRESAIAATREWARLSPLPQSAVNLNIAIKGSMFTREFIIEFEAPSAAVREWLMSSPGTAQAPSFLQDDGSLRYEIAPGGGAQFAEVIVSKDGTNVRIRAYWS